MSTLPPSWDPDDDADERYRRASGLDPSRPSETTRRAVLAEAERCAAGYGRGERRRRGWPLAGLTPGWRPAILGTLAAAVLVGIVVAPQFLIAPAPTVGPLPPAAPIERAPAAAPAAAAEVAQAAKPERAPPPAARESAGRAARQSVPSNLAPVSSAPGADGFLHSLKAEDRARAAAAPAAAVSRANSAPAAYASDASALRHAAETGDLTALEAQLAHGGDLESRDALGRTALMLATLNGRTEAVEALLAHGADPNAADARGLTPLAAAVAADENQIAAALKRHGAR